MWQISVVYSAALLFGQVLHATPSACIIQDQTTPPSLPPNTQAENIEFTPPEQALEWLDVPDGFSSTLFAAEPDVHQPIAGAFDASGRLWIVECYTYSDRKTNYDMSLNDRVVIFEDKNQDGKFDTRTIFWDKGKKLTGIEIGRRHLADRSTTFPIHP